MFDNKKIVYFLVILNVILLALASAIVYLGNASYPVYEEDLGYDGPITEKKATQEEIDRFNQQQQPKTQESEQNAVKQKLQTLTKSAGVYYYNGMRETGYSSRVLYHYKTPEGHLDDEGFWHDANDYYVVSCNYQDHKHGEVFETSKGLAIVLDTGCNVGTIDFYVNG